MKTGTKIATLALTASLVVSTTGAALAQSQPTGAGSGHSSGVGGYLIPDDRLTWVLRDMRAMWAAAPEPAPNTASPGTSG